MDIFSILQIKILLLEFHVYPHLFLFYIKFFSSRSNQENFDEFESGKITYMNYINSPPINIFPITFYYKLRDNENGDIIVSYSFSNNDTEIEKGDIDFKSYIVDQKYISERKKNKIIDISSYSNLAGDNIINSNNLSGESTFLSTKISEFTTNVPKYLLIQSSSENSKYNNITLKAEKFSSNPIIINENISETIIPLTNGNYFTTTLNSPINAFKFRKENEGDKFMKITLSFDKNLKILFSEYSEHTKLYDSIDDLNKIPKLNENETKEFGKKIYIFEDISNSFLGVLLYVYENNTDESKLRLLDDLEKKKISMKYNSYENRESLDNDSEDFQIDVPSPIMKEEENNLLIIVSPINITKEGYNVNYSLNFYSKKNYLDISEINVIEP